MVFYQSLIFISYFLPFIFLLLLWPSKKNIIFFQHLPMFFLADFGYIVFFFNEAYTAHNMSFNNLESLTYVLFIGSLFTTLFIYVGFKVRFNIKKFFISKSLNKFQFVSLRSVNLQYKVFLLTSIGIVLMLYAYVRMGFVPIFAENPMDAKFFAGQYYATYKPVAAFFRIGLNILIVVSPFLMIYVTYKNAKMKLVSFIFLICTLLLLLSTMRRGPMASAVLYVIMIHFLYYKNGKFIGYYFLVYFFIFAFGSTFNWIVLYLFGIIKELSILDIFRGVPDIHDLFWFWNSFQNGHHEFALGRLIYGGIVPYHYEWNPGNYTKVIVGGTGYGASGGFRLPDAVWGYVNFGWIGVIIWSSFAGFVSGLSLKVTKTIINNYSNDAFNLFVLLYIFNIFILLFSNLLMINIDLIVSFTFGMFLLLFFSWGNQKRI